MSVNKSGLSSTIDEKASAASLACRFSTAAGRTEVMSSLHGVRNRALKSSLYGEAREAGEYLSGYISGLDD